MSRKNVFIRIGIAMAVYLLLSDILSTLMFKLMNENLPQSLRNINIMILPGFVIQYAIAFPLAYLIISKAPKAKMPKLKMRGKDFFIIFSVVIALASIGAIVSGIIVSIVQIIFGKNIINPIAEIMTQVHPAIIIIVVSIIGPLMEELLFRKIIIDRTIQYGEGVAILFSSIMFAVIHLNIYQLFYSFLFGACCGYVYVKTGQLKYSIMMHIMLNLRGALSGILLESSGIGIGMVGVQGYMKSLAFLSPINILSLFLLSIISLGSLVLTVIGIYYLVRKRKQVKLKSGELASLNNKDKFKFMYLNAGMIVFVLVLLYESTIILLQLIKS